MKDDIRYENENTTEFENSTTVYRGPRDERSVDVAVQMYLSKVGWIRRILM
jgi:hypothetical protein